MAASMRDVAIAASVSIGTVSNVLNSPQKVAPATAERVHRAIVELGFVRNDAARQLKAGRSRCVGLIVLDVGNPFFTDLARAAERQASDNHLTLLLGTSDDDAVRENTYIEAFDEQRVFGLLVAPASDDLGRLEALQQRGTPVVLVDRNGFDTPFPSVAVDDVAGGELACGHLCDIGRRRIAFIGGPAGLRQVADRLQGARQAIENVPGAALEVIGTESLSVLAGRAAGEEIRARPLADRPDGVFCANDLLAMGVLQALTMLGDVSVPDDVALIGYDDIDFAQSAVVPLSSISQPSRQLGARAIDLLVDEANRSLTSSPQHILFQPRLVARASTGQ
ncbi:MAG: LacI family DNA-binding transcriptional regulator [Gordonia sp. (in: high G+C Gram-positive bacteria)]